MEQQLKEVEIKPNKLAFQVSIAFSVYTLALLFIFKLLNIDTQEEHVSNSTRLISSVASYMPFVLAVLFVQLRHRRDVGGYISFGKVFSAGFKVGAYTGLFVALLLVLYYKVLDVAALDHFYQASLAKIGTDKPAELKNAEQMKPFLPIYIAFGGAMIYTIFGLIVSLVGAVAFKSEKP